MKPFRPWKNVFHSSVFRSDSFYCTAHIETINTQTCMVFTPYAVLVFIFCVLKEDKYFQNVPKYVRMYSASEVRISSYVFFQGLVPLLAKE